MTTTLIDTTMCTPCGRTRPTGHLLDMERRLAEALMDLRRNTHADTGDEPGEFANGYAEPLTGDAVPAPMRRLIRMVDTYAAHDGANADTVRQLRLSIDRDLLGVDVWTPSYQPAG